MSAKVIRVVLVLDDGEISCGGPDMQIIDINSIIRVGPSKYIISTAPFKDECLLDGAGKIILSEQDIEKIRTFLQNFSF